MFNRKKYVWSYWQPRMSKCQCQMAGHPDTASNLSLATLLIALGPTQGRIPLFPSIQDVRAFSGPLLPAFGARLTDLIAVVVLDYHSFGLERHAG